MLFLVPFFTNSLDVIAKRKYSSVAIDSELSKPRMKGSEFLSGMLDLACSHSNEFMIFINDLVESAQIVTYTFQFRYIRCNMDLG